MTATAIRQAVTESVDGVIVDRDTHEVWVDGRSVRLPPKEYRILEVLAEADGSILPRAELLSRIWGQEGDVDTRTVDQHIARLRRSLGKKCAAVIVTVVNCGYRASDGLRFKSRRIKASVDKPKDFSEAMTKLAYWAGLKDKADVTVFVAEASRLASTFVRAER